MGREKPVPASCPFGDFQEGAVTGKTQFQHHCVHRQMYYEPSCPLVWGCFRLLKLKSPWEAGWTRTQYLIHNRYLINAFQIEWNVLCFEGKFPIIWNSDSCTPLHNEIGKMWESSPIISRLVLKSTYKLAIKWMATHNRSDLILLIQPCLKGMQCCKLTLKHDI